MHDLAHLVDLDDGEAVSEASGVPVAEGEVAEESTPNSTGTPQSHEEHMKHLAGSTYNPSFGLN